MQDDVTKKLGERILDISFWKFELERVIQDLLAETDLLSALKRQLENAYRSTELPLHIATDNLNCRLRRQGVDLVEDPVELALLKVNFVLIHFKKKSNCCLLIEFHYGFWNFSLLQFYYHLHTKPSYLTSHKKWLVQFLTDAHKIWPCVKLI